MAEDRSSKKRARPEMTPNGSDEQTLTTANMPIRTTREQQAIAQSTLSLVDFLQHDPRPTCILDTTAGYLVYRNPALDQLLAGTWDARDFYDWATSALNTHIQTPTYRGRAWNCILQQDRWLVASAQQDEPTAPPAAPEALAPSRIPPAPRTTSRNSTSSSDSRRQSITSTSWRTVSDEGGQRYLDWTRMPSPAMSAHMHLVRNFPWQDTIIGSIHSWSDALRSAVLSAMANPDPRLLLWGDDHIMIYNEACTSMFADRHPRAMGSRAEDTWADIWPEIAPLIKYVQTEGRGTRLNKLPLVMSRSGYPEDTYWSFNLIPIIGNQGATIGIIDEFSEVTEHVVADRRRDAVVKINKAIANVNSVKELWFEFLEGLEPCRDDIPYALLHTSHTAADPSVPDTDSSSSGPESQRYALEGSIGLAAGHPAVPLTFDLAVCANDQSPLAQAFYKAWKTGDVVILQFRDGTLPPLLNQGVPGRASGAKVQTVCVIPLPDMSAHRTMGFLTLALTPRRPYDSDAAMFAYYLRDILVKSASAICLPEEQRRARQKFEQVEASLAQQLRATTLETERLESRYANMAQLAPVAMYAITPDARTTFHNKAYLDITGITEEAIEAQTDPQAYIHLDDRERVTNAWIQCLEEKQPFTIEYRVTRPWSFTDPISGEIMQGDTWVLATAAPELDDDGNIIHIQGWLLDVSDRKYHEKSRIRQIEVEQSEERFARLAADAPLGMYLLNPTGEPLYLNEAYFRILGFTREEFEENQRTGVGWADRIHDDDKAKVGEAWLALAQYGTPLNLEYRIKKPWTYIDDASGLEMTGETWLQGTAIAEIGIDGSVVAVQGFVTEISLKKASERLLSERLEDALEHKHQADRFIDMTSHEMRNPLSAILQSADGILTTLENNNRLGITCETTSMSDHVMETVIDSAQTIILCAQHQGRIVDDILTLSKLDSNLLIVSPDTVDMPGLMEKCFKMHEAELVRADITISLRIHEGFRNLAVGKVMLDSSRLLQVIINLLTNAIKFTQFASHKEIIVHLDASLTRPKEGMHGCPYVPFRANRPEHHFTAEWGTGDEIFLSLSVQDSGKGMSDEELKLLFNRFSQASPKTYKQYGGLYNNHYRLENYTDKITGSGLGLFISRELTDLQDGQIGVHSEPDKGSTFSFYIKARRAVDDDDYEDFGEGTLTTPTLNTPVTYTRDPASNSLEVHLDGSPHATNHTTIRKLSSVSTDLTEEKPHLHVLIVEDNVINQRVSFSCFQPLSSLIFLVAGHVSTAPTTRMYSLRSESRSRSSGLPPQNLILGRPTTFNTNPRRSAQSKDNAVLRHRTSVCRPHGSGNARPRWPGNSQTNQKYAARRCHHRTCPCHCSYGKCEE